MNKTNSQADYKLAWWVTYIAWGPGIFPGNLWRKKSPDLFPVTSLNFQQTESTQAAPTAVTRRALSQRTQSIYSLLILMQAQQNPHKQYPCACKQNNVTAWFTEVFEVPTFHDWFAPGPLFLHLCLAQRVWDKEHPAHTACPMQLQVVYTYML